MRLPVGISNFKEIIEDQYIFVDKSLLIKELIDDTAKVILFVRPRRFGKTLNMSMIQHFFDRDKQGHKNLFENLQITKTNDTYLKHQGQYPVIFLSFKDIKEKNTQDNLEKFEILIRNLYDQYHFLLSSDHLSSTEKNNFQLVLEKKANATELQNSLKKLSEYLSRYYGKNPIILIDEYDTPIHAAYFNAHYTETIDFMRGLLSGVLKDNDYLHKAILTGILRISKESLFSGLNNLEVYSILQQDYGPYFGFTSEEIKKLFSQSQQFQENNNPYRFEDVQEWYNGYNFAGVTIYNPWSIIQYFRKRGLLQAYWVNTSDNSLLSKLLIQSDFSTKEKLMKLLQRQTVTEIVDEQLTLEDLNQNSAVLWSFLLMTGYLKSTKNELIRGKLYCELSIPNLEVLYLYENLFSRWLTDHLGQDTYSNFIQALIHGNMDTFSQQLEAYLESSFSYFDFPYKTAEQVYHAFMLGLVAGLSGTHLIKSNRESGYGRYDLAIIPIDQNRHSINDHQHPALLFEFKSVSQKEDVDTALKQALQQMQDQHYQNEIINLGIEKINILMIAIVFCGKKVACAYQWGELSTF